MPEVTPIVVNEDGTVNMTKVQLEAIHSALSMALHVVADHRVKAVFKAYGIEGAIEVAETAHVLVFEQYIATNNMVAKMPDEPRAYGVSFGNGNDGVSQSYPQAVVVTNEPFVLARLAMVSGFMFSAQPWANDACEVDGEKEHTITAMISEGPDGETEFGAAWRIVEVFPVDDDAGSRGTYMSIDEYALAVTSDEHEKSTVLAVCRAEES